MTDATSTADPVDEALSVLLGLVHTALDLEHAAEVAEYRCPKALHGLTRERNAAILAVTRRLETLDLRRPEHRACAMKLIDAIGDLDVAIANRGSKP